ncbi:MAG: NAD(P)-binding domain-containing protein, partial [Longimicrobiales bacterium]
MGSVAVVGAGNWGTALANLLAKKGLPVRLWAYEDEVARGVNERHENPLYLRGVPLDPRLKATPDLAEAVTGADVILSVTPAQHVRGVMAHASRCLSANAVLVSASKGIETGSLATMAEVLADVAPHVARACFLSGPS